MATEKTSSKPLAVHTCEIWKPIDGYEGLYEVSNLGRIRRDGHTLSIKAWGAYKIAKLYRNGRYESKYVHRLVAEAFVPNPDGKPCVNHIDCDKLNNRAENLEWCTRQENEIHAWKNGLKEKIRETSRTNAVIARAHADNRIPVSQYEKDGTLVKEWPSATEAMRELGIDGSTITKCCRGKLKQTGGFIWRYTA